MKIIMALAGLDIGGAETHVVELSKELKRRGNDVIMISGGGVYEKEVTDAGIKHYTVPIKKRSYTAIIKAKGMIKKIIKSEKPDIVHSHARIPSFIIGVIHREMRHSFVYVTTAHWTFDTSFVVRHLTCWGDKTLSVSEDIKKYLLKYYDVNPKNIYISINGIDPGKFSKDVRADKIIKEFDLNPEARRITYVSRLNPLVCAPAFGIIEKIEKINAAVPGVEVIIVGDGDSYAEMKQKADEANKRLGRRAIILTGGRTDINEIHAAAEVCVGVSRAILEPMCMEKKCVIAGQEGYIGILDESKLAEAIDCNFTCRGCAPLDSDRLADDIISLFKCSDEESKKITDYGKYVVDNYYSVKKMADDNYKMYCDAIYEHAQNTVILGYYGYDNRGDDALLYSMLSDISEQSDVFSPVVMSHNPERTQNEYHAASIDRFNIFKVRRAMKRAKLFIVGGGSLIQDVTSTKSLLYYLFCIRMALRRNVKVMLYANGIGPVNGERNRKITEKILNKADVITLRDEMSRKILTDMNVTKPKIRVTGDPAFCLSECDFDGAEKILSEFGINGKYICFSVRSFVSMESDFAKHMAAVADYVYEKHGYTPVFVPMQYEKDIDITRRTAQLMKNRCAVVADKSLSVSEISAVVSRSEGVIGTRLHMLIFGVALGVPVCGISYDPKIDGFLDSVGSNFCISLAELEDDMYKDKTDRFIRELDKIRTVNKNTADKMRAKAKETAHIAAELLNS